MTTSAQSCCQAHWELSCASAEGPFASLPVPASARLLAKYKVLAVSSLAPLSPTNANSLRTVPMALLGGPVSVAATRFVDRLLAEVVEPAITTQKRASSQHKRRVAVGALLSDLFDIQRDLGARKELEQGLRADLLDRVRSMSPAEFEELIVQLLLRMGYGNGAEELARALGGSGDRGIDGVVHQDPLGLDRVYIQAKRYSEGNTVGSREIRDFNGALDLVRAPKGLFVTASTFTRDARAQAQNATRQIVLIDGDELAGLMVRYKVGTRVLATIEVQGLDEGFF